LFYRKISRRLFLKASLAASLMLLEGTQCLASIPPEQTDEGRLTLFNSHSRERLTLAYRDSSGNIDQEAVRQFNWILRCHSGEVGEMDMRVIEYLSLVDKQLGGNNEIHIISGFRSPNYNAMLRKRSRGGVARKSLHMKGKAIDIAVPGVDLHTLRTAALDLRYGGVGYYPGPGFVHIDSGSFRAW